MKRSLHGLAGVVMWLVYYERAATRELIGGAAFAVGPLMLDVSYQR